jgi:translation initiation factor 1
MARPSYFDGILNAMADRTDRRIVYSTGAGRVCPTCGWPAHDCKCSSTNATAAVPDRVVAKLRLETKGRGGKGVTVVYDLPHNSEFLKSLAQELKRACGVGGTVAGDTIELQGDQRERLRPLLLAKKFVVKG